MINWDSQHLCWSLQGWGGRGVPSAQKGFSGVVWDSGSAACWILLCFPSHIPPCLFQVAEELAAKKEAEKQEKEKDEEDQEQPKVKKPEKAAGKQVRHWKQVVKSEAKLRCGQRLLSDIKLVSKAPARVQETKDCLRIRPPQPLHDLNDSGELFTSHVLGMATSELSGKSW